MNDLVNVGSWLSNCMVVLWDALGTWGTIGFGIVIMLLLPKILKVVKRLFSIK